MGKIINRVTILSALTLVICSCSNSNPDSAAKQAQSIQTAVKENTPGSVPVSEGGYTMRAKINGKEWGATSMMPPEVAGRIIGYYNGEYIGLPYDKQSIEVGKKEIFSEDNAVDLALNDDIGIWGGRKGEMQITKVTDTYAEGNFFFTASSTRSNKTVEVTDGFFRIVIDK
ncbi:MAG: hypothetical protein ABI480_12165 [Chitinophagaceae bacterium]